MTIMKDNSIHVFIYNHLQFELVLQTREPTSAFIILEKNVFGRQCFVHYWGMSNASPCDPVGTHTKKKIKEKPCFGLFLEDRQIG